MNCCVEERRRSMLSRALSCFPNSSKSFTQRDRMFLDHPTTGTMLVGRTGIRYFLPDCPTNFVNVPN